MSFRCSAAQKISFFRLFQIHSDEPFDAGKSTAFFDNLLPEGYMHRELCREARIDEVDTYNFLRRYGQECAGAL
ncbi:HipA N-terminal domain-containing protein, partial [Desulfosarcina sp. OttesenSCG-928-B08]|nr:HipA N-terminal domain-containing protein [Desulfosarcina sp. OttesenSCG-928-B08]